MYLGPVSRDTFGAFRAHMNRKATVPIILYQGDSAHIVPNKGIVGTNYLSVLQIPQQVVQRQHDGEKPVNGGQLGGVHLRFRDCEEVYLLSISVGEVKVSLINVLSLTPGAQKPSLTIEFVDFDLLTLYEFL